MRLLDERELTAEERTATSDEPRPGVWIEGDAGSQGDRRVLTQNETDCLIVCELLDHPDRNAKLCDLLAGWRQSVLITHEDGRITVAAQQRGGIHSDPIVRLLAYRAWGDRDRSWRHPCRRYPTNDLYTIAVDCERCGTNECWDAYLRWEKQNGIHLSASHPAD